MKKSILCIIMISFLFCACGRHETTVNQSGDSYVATGNNGQTDVTENVNDENDVYGTDDFEKKLKMTVDDQEVIITLYDTPESDELYDMCPLELIFEDYNGTEKISFLPHDLSVDGETDGCEPEAGDLCYYAPWGNLAAFYQDFEYSDNLILLGYIDSGLEVLEEQYNDFSVVLERYTISE